MTDTTSVNLEACEREPIHIPGSIQPHGVLLVVDPASEAILQAAGDAALLLGYGGSLLGAPVHAALGVSLADLLRKTGAALMEEPTYIGSIQPKIAGPELTITAHQARGGAVLEIEPAFGSMSAPKALATIRAIAERVSKASNLLDACRMAAREIHRLTGYDRVMVYQFLPDGSGCVIAEDKDEHLPPYLHHRYPASDIPKQARELYRRNPIRVVPDVQYTPAPLLPVLCPMTGQPLDMSHCGLRSVSPVHIRYLKNMGVGASMSVSLLRKGELWGLIACHNTTARLVPYEEREACRHVGQILSHSVEAREEADTYRAAVHLSEAREAVLHALRSADAPVNILLDQCHAFQDVVPSHGVAVSTNGELRIAGHTPAQEQVERLTAWLRQRLSASDGFVTDRLSDEYPEASKFTSTGSGLLAISVPADEPVILMWFRAEQVEEIRWAGNPHEALEPGSTPGALNPRRSFATWSETVRGRSRSWSAVEIASAQAIRPRLASVLQRQKIRELNVLLREANERLSAQALTDGLTGVPNRRAFGERLEHEWARASRHGRSLALLVVDVDHFKQYNDHFGHLEGDECLKRVAQVLRTGRRTSDLAARFGGEEFCVLLPDTDLQGASRVAETIRSSVAALGMEHPRSQIGHVTVSIGVAAAIPDGARIPQNLLQAADEALYRAKAAGRNRVEGARLETASA